MKQRIAIGLLSALTVLVACVLLVANIAHASAFRVLSLAQGSTSGEHVGREPAPRVLHTVAAGRDACSTTTRTATGEVEDRQESGDLGMLTGEALPEGKGVFATRGAIWSSTKKLSSVENAFGHFKKHGGEFPGIENAKQYVDAARRFTGSPPSGALTKVRGNGDVLIYDGATNTFGVRAADGVPRTMFRPDPAKHGYPTNLDYFNAQ